MISFRVSSVEMKFCKQIKIKVLEDVDICLICKHIPLPYYRSILQPDNFYCKKCYEIQNFDPKTTIVPHKRDIKLLEKLIISFKFFEKGCLEKYDINSLDDLLLHEKKCQFNNNISSIFKNAPLDIASNKNTFV